MSEGKRSRLSLTQRSQIWSRWKAGQSLHEIGRAFDKPHSSIRCLLLPRGGIPPAARRRSRLALTLAEREDISRGIASGSSIREIARHVDRAASTAIRERRRILRYCNPLVRQMVQMKIKISSLLMEAGVRYCKQRLHQAGHLRELLATNPDIDEGLSSLLRLCRETVMRLQRTESALVWLLERDSLLMERVERLMTIPAVGPITALTWVLEVGDVQRFSSITEYCERFQLQRRAR
jgi:hypothetical protein